MKIFREILTIAAGVLVVALAAALAAPYLVDWNARRTDIEARLSVLAGLPVRVGGEIDVRILPAPRLVLGNVSASAPSGFSMAAQHIVLEIAPLALLRGEWRFAQIHVDAPDVAVPLAADGALRLPAWPDGAPDQLAFEAIAISKGRFRIVRGGQTVQFEDIALEASAASLSGPWRADGSVRHRAGVTPFHLNTSVREGNRLRLKLALDASGDLPRGELDGALEFAAGSDGLVRLALEGQARSGGILGSVPASGASLQWDVSGPFRLDAGGVALDPLDLRVSAGERTITAKGIARHDFGDALARVELESPRLDLDFLADQPAKAGAAMPEAAAQLTALLAGVHGLPPLRAMLKSPAVTIGGETLSGLALSLVRQDERTAALTFSSNLPGRAALSLDGVVETGSAARFKGRTAFEMRDPERLRQWIARAYPVAETWIAALPFAHVEMNSEIDISAAGMLVRNLDILVDRSRFHGLVSATRAIGGERARIVADLSSPALDLDHVPDLTPLTSGAQDFDFSVRLDARAVRLARVGQGMIDAGRIEVRVARANGELAIERLDISGLGGANFSATGGLGGKSAQLSIRLDAERLVELAALSQRIAPGTWSDALARRAIALSPATLTFSVQAERQGENLRLNTLAIDGTARGTRVNGSFTPGREDPRHISGRITLVNGQSAMLLRQIGFETIALSQNAPGRIEIEAAGNAGSSFEARARASLAGTSLEWQGRVNAMLPQSDLRGGLKVASKDASPLLQILAIAMPDALTQLPLDLAGVFSTQDGRFALADIAGHALGVRVAGDLAYGPVALGELVGRRLLSGKVKVERLSLEGLAALVLGPRPPAKAGALWPDVRFAAAPADLPMAKIEVETARLMLPAGETGDARFTLELAPGLAGMSNASLGLARGAARGQVYLRRDGANASLNGEIGWEGPLSGGDTFTAGAKVALAFAGSGSSYAAIVAGLGGRGSIVLGDLRIASADMTALDRVLAASADTLEVSETKIAALLATELARAESHWGAANFDLALAGGHLSLATEKAQALPSLAATLDLRTLNIDATLRFGSLAPEGWKAAPPEAALRWTGPAHAPRRSLNIASLVNGLGALAIEREAARIEMLEYDARERAAFNRRRRALEFLQQRNIEIAAFQAEQERLSQEAWRKAEEEKRKAEEDARRKVIEEQRAAARRSAADAEREKRDSAPRPSSAPLQLTPQKVTPASPQAQQPAPAGDPAAAGRY